MITLILISGLFIVGAALGSFAMATVWRLRVLDVAAEKEAGGKLTAEDKRLLKQFFKHGTRPTKLFSARDRSQCLHCHTQLRWYDLLPVVSWLSLGGRCRYCQQPIGSAEFLAEVGLGGLFALSYVAWPFGFVTPAQIALFATWLVALVLLAIQALYDAKWYLLPRLITLLLGGVALIYAAIYFFGVVGMSEVFASNYLVHVALSLLILPGFYGVLYVVSKERWIGLGDVELLVPMAIMVASWPASLLLVFLANLIGCLVVLPGLASKKLGRMSRIPFGPFLIAAFIIVILWGSSLIGLYMDTLIFKP